MSTREPRQPSGGAGAVFMAFVVLGLTSFGGPVAHLGYFRREFVERRQWFGERSYSELVALCQFLPGPASSQVGMAIGLSRAGWRGALAAWAGFTLPSAIALIAFAYVIAGHGELARSPLVHGLKIAAVAVVAQAVWSMARSLCPDRPRAGIAVLAALLTLSLPTSLGQLGAIAASALIGWRVLARTTLPPALHARYGVSRRAGVLALVAFTASLLAMPLAAAASGSLALSLLDGVYRAGALVFGGGHVVLPLLQAAVVPSGAVSNQDFLAGYGAAQAVPGPLFTFAAYLGAIAAPVAGVPAWLGGLASVVAIFVPGFLLLAGALPFWESLRARADVQSAMAGVNAGVVGVLLSALYDPVWTSAIHSRGDFALALAAFALLAIARWSPVLVVACCAAAAWSVSQIAAR